MWGCEYGRAARASWALDAAARTAELLLDRRIFRSVRTDEVIDRCWLALRYPPYWHYDVLVALLLLARLGKATDPRAAEALEYI